MVVRARSNAGPAIELSLRAAGLGLSCAFTASPNKDRSLLKTTVAAIHLEQGLLFARLMSAS